MSCFKKKPGRVNTLYISNDCEEETFRQFSLPVSKICKPKYKTVIKRKCVLVGVITVKQTRGSFLLMIEISDFAKINIQR